MRKLVAIFLAVCISFGLICIPKVRNVMIGSPQKLLDTKIIAVSGNTHANRVKIEKEISRNLNYGKTYNKFSGTTIYQKSQKSPNILVMGSSELMLDFLPQNPVNFFRNRINDFDMYLQGEAGYLSLEHAIELGSFAPVMKNRKVVLILSPQWFTKDGIIPTDFFPHFSSYHFERFLKNDSISTKTKNKVANRVKELYLGGPTQGTDVKKSISFIKRVVPVGFFKTYKKALGPLNSLIESKDAIKPYNDSIVSLTLKHKRISAKDIDWQAEFVQAEADGKVLCTTNDFNIRDDFFNTLIKPKLESLKGSDMNESYVGSREYEDLKLFLQVCKEIHVKPMIINIPLNGKWYDYTGFPLLERQKHYENIRKIAADYNVKLTDLSDHEYDPYFFCDPVHIGWKGWLHVDQSTYNFYKE